MRAVDPELPKALQRAGKRRVGVLLPRVVDPAAVPESSVSMGPSPMVVAAPPLAQRAHQLSQQFHIARAADVELSAGTSTVPRSAEAFRHNPVAPGCFVVTRPAPKSPLGRASKSLRQLPFWVWRVLRVFDPGSALPANTLHLEAAVQPTYEAHLYCPVGGGSMSRPLRPVWDVQGETAFLRTPAEKAAKAAKAARKGPHGQASGGPARVHTPLTAFLRTDNLIGGGFPLTVTSRLPQVVRTYVSEVVAEVCAT